LPPLATTLKEEEFLEREGSPLTEDFSTMKGAGLRATDAITEEAIFQLRLSVAASANDASSLLWETKQVPLIVITTIVWPRI